MSDGNGDKKRSRDPFETRYDHEDDRDDVALEGESSPSESAERSETSDDSKTSKRAKTAKMSKSTKTTESEESTGTVRERKNVNMYLPESLVDKLQLRYSELNVEWRRQHGEDMPKNEEFYPAVIRSSLSETSIKEELGLEE